METAVYATRDDLEILAGQVGFLDNRILKVETGLNVTNEYIGTEVQTAANSTYIELENIRSDVHKLFDILQEIKSMLSCNEIQVDGKELKDILMDYFEKE